MRIGSRVFTHKKRGTNQNNFFVNTAFYPFLGNLFLKIYTISVDAKKYTYKRGYALYFLKKIWKFKTFVGK